MQAVFLASGRDTQTGLNETGPERHCPGHFVLDYLLGILGGFGQCHGHGKGDLAAGDPVVMPGQLFRIEGYVEELGSHFGDIPLIGIKGQALRVDCEPVDGFKFIYKKSPLKTKLYTGRFFIYRFIYR